MSEAWAGGSTRAWRRVRALVLARDAYRCQLQLEGCTATAPLQGGHVHHLHGRGRCAGCKADQPAHMVASCRSCNIKTGDPGTGRGRPRPKVMTKW